MITPILESLLQSIAQPSSLTEADRSLRDLEKLYGSGDISWKDYSRGLRRGGAIVIPPQRLRSLRGKLHNAVRTLTQAGDFGYGPNGGRHLSALDAPNYAWSGQAQGLNTMGRNLIRNTNALLRYLKSAEKNDGVLEQPTKKQIAMLTFVTRDLHNITYELLQAPYAGVSREVIGWDNPPKWADAIGALRVIYGLWRHAGWVNRSLVN
jgi:hypothetical protein